MSAPLPHLEARAAALDGDTTPAHVDALNALAYALGPSEAGRIGALAAEARALADRLGHAPGRAFATALAGYARLLQADPLGALHLLLEAERDRHLLPPDLDHWVQHGLAWAHRNLGNFEEVLRILQSLLDRVRAEGYEEQEAWALVGLSGAATDLDAPRDGLRFGHEALALFDRLGLPDGQAQAHVAVGTALCDLDRRPEAKGHHERGLALARQAGDVATEAQALHALAVLAQADGSPRNALLLHRVALDLRREAGLRPAECESLLEIGRALRAVGKPKEAVDTMEQALELAEAVGAKLRASQAHVALAEAYETLGRMGHALRHLRRNEAVREEILGQEMTSRLEALSARHTAERALDDAERARRYSDELGRKNDALETALAELRQAQARLVQAEKLASLGRLTAGVAHELKNPLNFVTNFADLSVDLVADVRDGVGNALGHGLPVPLAEDLETLGANLAKIAEHGRRADRIVRSMMGHARSGPGERRLVDVHGLLRVTVEATRQARLAAGSPASEVALVLGSGVPHVEGVPEDLGRAVAGLVENALYAVAARAVADGDAYRPAVTVRTRCDGALVEVVIEDNGPGLTEEARARAFEPFYTTKPTGEGTGLGLSMAWDTVVQGHGGELVILDTSDAGAAFAMRLPAP